MQERQKWQKWQNKALFTQSSNHPSECDPSISYDFIIELVDNLELHQRHLGGVYGTKVQHSVTSHDLEGKT